MAIYHASVKAFSRGQGHSGTAAAAYRAGIAIADDLTGTRHDYTKRKGVASVDMLAPSNAPEWARDPAACFNRSEQAETRANARVARELEVALPHELSEDQRHALAVDLGQMLVEKYGVGVLVAVHTPDKSGDERNHHAHLLMTPRQIGPDGLGARACQEFDARGGAGPAAIRELREAVAVRINEHLAQAGLAETVDHRSLPKQAKAAEQEGRLDFVALLAREPTTHEGKAATAMRRRGEYSDRAAENDAVKTGNRIELQAFLKQLESEGRLMPTPPKHTAEAATKERHHEQQAKPAALPVRSVLTHLPSNRIATPKSGKATMAKASTGKAAGLGLKREDADYFKRRQAEAEERMREAEQAGREWLATLEKTGRRSSEHIQQLLKSCDPKRAQEHAYKPGFTRLAKQLTEDIKQASQDATRWDRRLERLDRKEHQLSDAKRRQQKADEQDQRPGMLSMPATKREWAERRRKRQQRVDVARKGRDDAKKAVGPDAQDDYTRRAAKSLSALENTVAKMRSQFPVASEQQPALAPKPQAKPTMEQELENQRKAKQRQRFGPKL